MSVGTHIGRGHTYSQIGQNTSKIKSLHKIGLVSRQIVLQAVIFETHSNVGWHWQLTSGVVDGTVFVSTWALSPCISYGDGMFLCTFRPI